LVGVNGVASRCNPPTVVALRSACQRLFDILLRASTRVDNLDDMHDAICHAAARFRHDASARCFVPIFTISMSEVSIFLRVATPFQLPLVNFYERVSLLPTEAAVDGNADGRCTRPRGMVM
jgi:hypothetical protein